MFMNEWFRANIIKGVSIIMRKSDFKGFQMVHGTSDSVTVSKKFNPLTQPYLSLRNYVATQQLLLFRSG
jgi:hypothetical protein